MRSTLRLFANPSTSRFLTSGAPTGLTGLLTHPSPRATLIVLYTATLSKLRSFPAHSSYRASTEALTRHRLSVIESIKPPGWDEWNERAQGLLQKYPNLFRNPRNSGRYLREEVDGKVYVQERLMVQRDPDTQIEWRDERQVEELEGTRDEGERDLRGLEEPREKDFDGEPEGFEEWVPEPKLEAKQISEIEEKIGAGLIEEVIEVAEGEFELVNTMFQNKVWEELQDKPAAGQWQYFTRDQHVSGTQEPPK